jgi:hypothetical protein
LARAQFENQNCCFYTSEGNYLILTVEGKNAKDFAQKLSLKGGGNPQQVQ